MHVLAVELFEPIHMITSVSSSYGLVGRASDYRSMHESDDPSSIPGGRISHFAQEHSGLLRITNQVGAMCWINEQHVKKDKKQHIHTNTRPLIRDRSLGRVSDCKSMLESDGPGPSPGRRVSRFVQASSILLNIANQI